MCVGRAQHASPGVGIYLCFRQIWALNSKPKTCRMGLKLVKIIIGWIIEPNIDY